jgi:hypothetical protein
MLMLMPSDAGAVAVADDDAVVGVVVVVVVVVVVSCFSGCEFNFDLIEKFRLWYWQLRGLMSSTSLIGYIQLKKGS